jgi:hypothetical protein
MKPLFAVTSMLGFVALATQVVNIVPIAAAPESPSISPSLSADDAGFSRLADGPDRAGVGVEDRSQALLVVKNVVTLERYCKDLKDLLDKKGPEAALERRSPFHPRDCVGMNVRTLRAQSGQAERGGNGGGFPGVPGGLGGESGVARRAAESGSMPPGSPRGPHDRSAVRPSGEDTALVTYCVDFLQSAGKSVSSKRFTPLDCVYYFLDYVRGVSRSPSDSPEGGAAGSTGPSIQGGAAGPNGPSIQGGTGGQGGAAGAGPGGGYGGAGGAGIRGGLGGAGGAGGEGR